MTPLFTVLFTFPSRYLSTIGLLGVFSLAGWCRLFRGGFLRPPPTQDTLGAEQRSRKGLSPAAAALPMAFRSVSCCPCRVLQPRARLDGPGLGCAAFARHYLRHHYCFLFLRVLRCFSSPGSPPCGCRAFGTAGFPIRAPVDHGLRAAPHGLSQLIAPFIASKSLGIPRAPLLACRAARGNRRAPRHSTFPSQSVNELAPPHAGGTGAVPKKSLPTIPPENFFPWRITDSNR